MMFKPNLNDYDINILMALLTSGTNKHSEDKIKDYIIWKMVDKDYPLFYLFSKFQKQSGILREIYADVIVIRMQNDLSFIDSVLIDEVLKNASYEALICYGANSLSLEFSKRCKDEFYSRGILIEDKVELGRKRRKRL